MWRDNGISSQAIKPDSQEITLQFIKHARQSLKYQAFVAEAEGNVVGSASCQLYAGLYPLILSEQYRKYGYIWGVYVEPAYRQQGIATQLTQLTIDYLVSIGCTRAILNAAPHNRAHQRLGFSDGNLMFLDLEQ